MNRSSLLKKIHLIYIISQTANKTRLNDVIYKLVCVFRDSGKYGKATQITRLAAWYKNIYINRIMYLFISIYIINTDYSSLLHTMNTDDT